MTRKAAEVVDARLVVQFQRAADALHPPLVAVRLLRLQRAQTICSYLIKQPAIVQQCTLLGQPF